MPGPIHFGKNTRIKFVGGELFIKTDVIDYITPALDGIVKRSQDLRIPFEAFQPVWFDAIQQVFDAGGDPVPWPELSPAYAGWKSSVAPGKPILRLTDRMYDSVTSQTSDTIWEVGPKHIAFGSRVPYFIYHQEGTANMPARPMMTLPASAAATLNAMVISYIQGGEVG